MTKKIKVILTCLKQTSYEDYTHFFKEWVLWKLTIIMFRKQKQSNS